ncbi:MAG: hypothetical protein H7329_20300 [Opitutaceae bacterium]|nr:hypothetical protein [Cytophagales bacterium]
MSINPAFVGDGEGGRIGILFTREDFYSRSYSNARYPAKGLQHTYTSALAFDKLFKKVGYGIQIIAADKSDRANNQYLGIKACVAPKFYFTRKNKEKQFSISPAIDITILTTNNRYISSMLYFQNGYYYTKPVITSERDLDNWPGESKQANFGFLYCSNKTKIGFKLGYHMQSIQLREAIQNVHYDLKPGNYQNQELSQVSEAIRNTPFQFSGNKSKHKWTEYEWSINGSQRIDIWKKKNLALDLFGYYQNIMTKNVSNLNAVYIKSENNIISGVMIKYQKLLFGIQPTLRTVTWKGRYYSKSWEFYVNDLYYIGFENKRLLVLGSFYFYEISAYGTARISTTISATYLF